MLILETHILSFFAFEDSEVQVEYGSGKAAEKGEAADSESEKERYEANILQLKEKYEPMIKTLKIAFNADRKLNNKSRAAKQEEIKTEIENLNGVLTRCETAIKTSDHDVLLGVRPEDIYREGDKDNIDPSPCFEVSTEISELLGKEFNIYGSVADQKIAFKVSANEDFKTGQLIKCSFAKVNAHIFDEDSTLRIEGLD